MSKRSFGLDLHKKYATVCGISQQGNVVLRGNRPPLEQLPTRAAGTLTADDAAAVETTGNTWWASECLAPLAGRVLVVNPVKIRLIAEARINTDKLTAEVPARLLHSNIICEVWVPDERTCRYPQLISHHIRLAQEASRVKNYIHAILHRQQMRCPCRRLFSRAGRDWPKSMDLPEMQRLLVRQNLQFL